MGPNLLCATCAGKAQNKDVSTLNADGLWMNRPPSRMRTDQIGLLIPAVPTEEGDAYWGYGSVPDEGVDWWRQLPTWPKQNGEPVTDETTHTCKLCGRRWRKELIKGICHICLTSATAMSKISRTTEVLSRVAPVIQETFDELKGTHWSEACNTIDKAVDILQEAEMHLRSTKEELKWSYKYGKVTR